MAYDVTNPPKCIVPRLGNGHAIWAYAGNLDGIEGDGFFIDGAKRGMRVGDSVLLQSESGQPVLASVRAVSSSSASVSLGGVYYKITDAEQSAGLTEDDLATQYVPGDLRRYKLADDPDAAMATAIAVCAESDGGVIHVPGGDYEFSSPWNLDGAKNVTIRGAGGLSGGARPATRVTYKATDSSVFINMGSAFGCAIEDMQIRADSADYTGTLIYLGWGADEFDSYCNSIRRCNIGDSVGKNCTHLDLNRAILVHVDRVNFIYGNPSVKGQKSDGSSYSNVVSFTRCGFNDAQQAPVLWGGESWIFDSCTFEQLDSGLAGAFDCGSSDAATQGLTFINCWFGDVTDGGGTWLHLCGQGIALLGNRFGGHATSTHAINLISCNGVEISGNTFDLFSAGINFGDEDSVAVSITNNNFLRVAAPLANLNNAPADLAFNPNSPLIAVPAPCGTAIGTSPGWERSPNGIIRQWGSVSVAVGSPQAVNFPKTFPNGIHSLVVSLSAPSAASNTAYSTSVSATGFTANLNGSGGESGTVYWLAVGY